MDKLTSLSGRKVLVTGGSGFIGRRVLEFGAAHGIGLVALGRTDPQMPGVAHRAVDLTDRERLLDAVREIAPAGVIHLAAIGVRGSCPLPELLRVNAVGTASLLEAVGATTAAPVVVAGSGYEYGMSNTPLAENAPIAPATPYGISKAAAAVSAGWYARRMPVSLLRLFNVYGSGEQPSRLLPTIVRAARDEETVPLTDCAQIRDFVHVDDVAAVFWQALANRPQPGALRVMNVGSGAPQPLRHFVDAVVEGLRARGIEPRLDFGARPYRDGEPMVYAADTRRLRAVLGWEPTISLRQGVGEAVARRLAR